MPKGCGGSASKVVAICECDYSATPLAERPGVSMREAVIFMMADQRWKLIHCEVGFRPILESDPDELSDLDAARQTG
jgi:hypothetical protein